MIAPGFLLARCAVNPAKKNEMPATAYMTEKAPTDIAWRMRRSGYGTIGWVAITIKPYTNLSAKVGIHITGNSGVLIVGPSYISKPSVRWVPTPCVSHAIRHG